MTPLIEWTIKASVLAVVALAASACARRQSAAVRHALLAAGVISALALPALFVVSPGWDMPAAPMRLGGARSTEAHQPRTPQFTRAKDGVQQEAVAVPDSAPASAVTVTWFVVVAGAVISLLLLGVGLLRLAWLARDATAADRPDWHAVLTEASARLGIARPVQLLFSDRTSLPITWGHWRPRVLLPATAEQWPADRRRVVLLHELAHVARGDWRLHVCAEALRAVLWFNPLLWILCRRLRRESEYACDDRVLEAGVAGVDYAAHLIDLARGGSRTGRIPLPAPAIVETSSLERRVRAMLTPGVDRAPLGRHRRIAVLFTATALAISIAGGNAAQTFATFAGSVVDSQNAVLPGVTFALTQLPDGARYEVKSNREGRVELPGVQPGHYRVEVSLPGFATLRSQVELRDGERVEPQLTLHVGEIEETVTVTDDPAGARPPQFWNGGTLPQCPAVAPSADGVAIGGNIRPPKRTVNVPPVYPATLSGSGRSGVVELDAQIGTDGRISEVRVASGDPEFAASAVEAVRQWEWTPTLLNCQPVAIHATVHVNFAGR